MITAVLTALPGGGNTLADLVGRFARGTPAVLAPSTAFGGAGFTAALVIVSTMAAFIAAALVICSTTPAFVAAALMVFPTAALMIFPAAATEHAFGTILVALENALPPFLASWVVLVIHETASATAVILGKQTEVVSACSSWASSFSWATSR
jgi:hypothetical protein